MCKWFDDLINKFVKCEICVDSIFAFKTNSFNKTDLKLYYAIHTDLMKIQCCMHAAYTLHARCLHAADMLYNRMKYIMIK